MDEISKEVGDAGPGPGTGSAERSRSTETQRPRLAPLAASFAMNPCDPDTARDFSRALRIAATEQENPARAVELATRAYAVARVHPHDAGIAHEAATAMLRVLRLQEAFESGKAYLDEIEVLHATCPDVHVAIRFAQGAASLLRHPHDESSRVELTERLEALAARHDYSVDFAEAAADAFQIAVDEASPSELRAIKDRIRQMASRHPRSLRLDTALGRLVLLERTQRDAGPSSRRTSRAS